MEKEFLNKIKKDIENTGFITELKVGSLLYKNEWKTTHNSSYTDKDFSISREIDIEATKSFHNEEANLDIEYHLIIEVKRIDNRPWAIFTNPSFFKGFGWRLLHSTYNSTTKKSTIFSSYVWGKHPFDSKKRIGKAYHELFKKSDEKSKIFEAILTSCKAAYYYKMNTGETPFKNDFDKNRSVELHFYFPMVVIEGLLIEIYLDKEEIKIDEANWILVEHNYSSPHYLDSQTQSEINFFPVIVTLNYFEQYLSMFDNWLSSLTNRFADELTKLRIK